MTIRSIRVTQYETPDGKRFTTLHDAKLDLCWQEINSLIDKAGFYAAEASDVRNFLDENSERLSLLLRQNINLKKLSVTKP